MKKIFNSRNSDIDKTAFMNWRTNPHEPIQNMNVIANGYFQSAFTLAENCLNDNSNKQADILIFPMLFSVNHAIELYTKSICWSMNILLNYNSTFKENHDIRGIGLTAKQKIKEFGFREGHEETEFNKMIINLEVYLDDLVNTIADNDVNNAYLNIDFSRYPTNNHNEYHFYLKTYENVTLDLEYFIEIFKDINACLNSLSNYYYGLVVESWQTNSYY